MARAAEYELKMQSAVDEDNVGRPFLHRSCVPITEVNFRAKRKFYQENLLNNFVNECEGMCGV